MELGKRIEWIDELKGIAMLSVVIGHVILFSLKPSDNIFGQIILSYQMPLFFFLSGLVLAKIGSFKKLLSKLCQFLCPFFIIGGLYSYYIGSDMVSFMKGIMKLGYWYLPVLATFYILFYIIEKLSGGGKILQYFILPMIVWIMKMFIGHLLPDYIKDIASFGQLAYWPFFMLGVVFKRFDIINKISRFKWITTIALFIYVLLFTLNTDSFLSYLLMPLALIVFIVLFYKQTRDIMPKAVITQLNRIGSHTMDVYLYHYFFIVNIHLYETGQWVSDTNNRVIQAALLIAISISVSYLAIILGQFIRNLWISKIVYGKF